MARLRSHTERADDEEVVDPARVWRRLRWAGLTVNDLFDLEHVLSNPRTALHRWHVAIRQLDERLPPAELVAEALALADAHGVRRTVDGWLAPVHRSVTGRA